jgi:hypothetical protein
MADAQALMPPSSNVFGPGALGNPFNWPGMAASLPPLVLHKWQEFPSWLKGQMQTAGQGVTPEGRLMTGGDLTEQAGAAFDVATMAPLGTGAFRAAGVAQVPENAVGAMGGKLPKNAESRLPYDQNAVSANLDMSQEARMQRAREMGFNTDGVLYHVTDRDFDQFDNAKLGYNAQDNNHDTWAGRLSGIGIWTSDGPMRVAKGMSLDTDGGRTIPLYARGDMKQFIDYGLDDLSSHIKDSGGPKKFVQEMKELGYSGVRVNDDEFGVISTIIFDHSNIRSVNAAFDPAKKDSANLLAANDGRSLAAFAMVPYANNFQEKPAFRNYWKEMSEE